MDVQAQRKALFRAKLRESAQKQEKRIQSPLVRYNENDQPVCRVCNITLKSESQWPAHQVSRKHHEAIENIKAADALQKHAKDVNSEHSAEMNRPGASSVLPANFFDKQDAKRQKTDDGKRAVLTDHGNKKGSPRGYTTDVVEPASTMEAEHVVFSTDAVRTNGSKLTNKVEQSLQKIDNLRIKQGTGTVIDCSAYKKETSKSQSFREENQLPNDQENLASDQDGMAFPDGFFDSNKSKPNQSNQLPRTDDLARKHSELPEGFFDNRDADLRARGIEPVKVDISDAYKEFEKEIQEELMEVDDRLEEEEIDAAEVMEEYETLEQRAYREQVEMVKTKLLEVKSARLQRGQRRPVFMQESSDESSSVSEDDEEDFAVDWRAKHL